MLSLEQFKYVALSHKSWRHCCTSFADAGRDHPVAGVSSPGLLVRVVSGSSFPLQVVRPDGIPEMPLTVFVEELGRMLSLGSAYAYLREVVAFANWALHDCVIAAQGWRVYGEPREVRNLVQEYLTKVDECRVTRRPDTLGIRVAYVNAVDGTRINVRLLLAALKRLYEILGHPDRYLPDRYLLQWNRLGLDQGTLNTALRFLLHDAILDGEGRGVHLTTHLLRHGFATEMARLKVPVEVIAKILHQRRLEVTQYYSQPTNNKSWTPPRCCLSNALMWRLKGCPAKFACIGCSGNAPDPERRYQIETTRTWALEQITWARCEHLPAEERQMKRLVQDCELLLAEMTLIERARTDQRQQVRIRQERGRARK
jgi:hypothetical protein